MEGEFSQQRLLLGVVLTVVQVFLFDRGELVDRGVEAVLVEPVDPGQGCQFELVSGAERAIELHAFSLLEPNEGLG